MSHLSAYRWTASNISSLVETGIKFALRGGSTLAGPEINVTSCPSVSAASAMAYPIFPDERFEM
jgi:hypothetical protein